MTVRRAPRAVLVVLLLVGWLSPGRASAQPVREGRAEASVGLSLAGRVKIATVNAEQVSIGDRPTVVFQSHTNLEVSPGFVARFGIGVTSAFHVESSVTFNAQRLTTHITGDNEAPGGSGAEFTATETIAQYAFEGGVAVRPVRWRTPRVASFVTAGAGYERGLHEGETLLESGHSYYVGFGAAIGRPPAARANGRGSVRTVGLRLDARAKLLLGGASADQGLRLRPVFGASVFVRY